jgi:hypothetical protein
MSALLETLERDNPNLRSIMAAALKNVRPTHLFDRDVLAAWHVRPEGIRPDREPLETEKHVAAKPVLGRRLPVMS